MLIKQPSIFERLRIGWNVARHGFPARRTGGRWPTQVKEAPFLWPDWRIGQPQWQLINYEGYVEEGFNLNTLIYSAIMYKVRAMTAAPLRAYTGDRDNPEPLDADAPLAKLVDRPNPSSSWTEFHGSSIVYFNIAGNCYTLLDRPGGEGVPDALYTLRPDRVLIVPLKKGRGRGSYTVGYLYVPEGKNAWLSWTREQRMDAVRRDDSGVLMIPSEDMIHVKLPNPGDPLEGLGYGLSPISSLARSADVDNAVTHFLKLFFEKGVTVPGILSTEQPLTEDTIASLKERWQEMYGGYRQWAEEIGVLDYGMEYQRIGLTFDEMGFSDLDERNESRILGPFGVPPILIGSRLGLSRSTYSNYQEARQSFWDDTMVPETRWFEADYRYYLQDRDGRDFVAFDFSQVPIFKEAALAAQQQAFAEFQAGARTLNEYRQAAKLEEDPEGNYYLRPLTLMPVPFGAEPEAPPQEEKPPAEETPAEEPPEPEPDQGSTPAKPSEEGAAEAESDEREEPEGKAYEGLDFTIPESVQDAARRALAWREEHGRGGTSVGLATARLLARGGRASPEKVRHIARYFPRHEVDKQGAGWSPGEGGYPSNGRIAWGLWGGDVGRSWVNRLVARMDRESGKGGPGSGNFGHAGRPGQVGGSASGGGSGAIAAVGGTVQEHGTFFDWENEESITGDLVVEFPGDFDASALGNEDVVAFIRTHARGLARDLRGPGDIEDVSVRGLSAGRGWLSAHIEITPTVEAGDRWLDVVSGEEEWALYHSSFQPDIQEKARQFKDSAMIALFLPELAHYAVDTAGAIPSDDLHVTLFYLGSVGEMSTEDRATIERVLTNLGAEYAPIKGQINGFGRFDNGEEPVLWLHFDSAALPALRGELVERLKAVGIVPDGAHGFTPHVTLAYGNDAPISVEIGNDEVTVNAITLAWGGERVDFPLTGKEEKAIVPFEPAAVTQRPIFSPEAKQRLWQQQDATAVAWEPRFAEAGGRAFENDRRAVLATLTAAQRKAYERKQTVDWDAVGQAWLDYLANEAPANWWGEFEPAVRGLMETQGRMWAGLLGQEWDAAWLAGEWFDYYQLTFSQPILETTELDLSALLKQALREGWSIPQMQRAIEALFQRYVAMGSLTDTERAWFEERLPQYRLENIARTESLTSANLASLLSFAGLGATHKEWLDTPDNRTREDHRDAGARYREGGNPGPIPLAQPFIVGGEELMFPGDPKASPKQRCQCRCSLLPWSPALARVL